MNQLVFQSSTGQDVTNSLIVAQVFGKMHKNVLSDISNLSCSPEFNRLNFKPIKYFDSKNREQDAFEMTKDGFSFLVMGYTGAKAGEFKEAFIKEFNKRTEMLLNEEATIERAFMILSKRTKSLEQQVSLKTQQLELANQTIKELSPMANYAAEVLDAHRCYTITEIASQLGKSAQWLNKQLEARKIIRKVNSSWVITANYVDMGYHKYRTVPKTDREGNLKSYTDMLYTETGRQYIHGLFNPKLNPTPSLNAAA